MTTNRNAGAKPVIPPDCAALQDKVLVVAAGVDEATTGVDWVMLVNETAMGNPRVQTLYRSWLAQGTRIRFQALSPEQFRDRMQADSPATLPVAGSGLALSAVQQTVINYFREANRIGASDIHVTVGADSTKIEMRINGALYPVRNVSRDEGLSLLSTIYQSMCDLADISFKMNVPQDGRLKYEFLKIAGLFGARYAHINTVNGVFAVMRLIKDDQREPPSLPALGFLPQQCEVLDETLSRPSGVILNSGPTGSGKSTTARSMLHLWDQRARGAKRMITLEDPVEGAVKNAVQSPVIADKSDDASIARAWAVGRSAIVRLDPDGVFIGEIRDNESAMATINFAESGHLSISTQHASSPLGNLQRLRVLNVPEGFLHSSQLFAGLLAQRLLPVLCPACCLTWDAVCADAPRYGLLPFHRKVIAESFSEQERQQLRFINHAGCPHCIKKVMNADVSQGITGRTVIAEIMRTTAPLLRIYHQHGEDVARAWWRRQGGITMATHARTLALQGKVDPLMANELAPFSDDTQLDRLDLSALRPPTGKEVPVEHL